jgi:hypothetical protein
MMPHAMKVSEQTGLDPRLVIAQSALETGWGKSAPGNNFFGIKSHGQSGGNTMPTTEVINGQPVRVNDSFRAYAGMGESAADYAAFLKANPRYRGVLGAQGLDAQIEAMAGSGYATDPNYGAKLRQIAAGMQTPDGMPTTPVPSNAAAMSYAPGQQAIAGAAPQQPAQGQRLAQAVTSPPIPAPQPTGNVQQAMMAVLSDPRFSPQQKSQALQMFQMTQRDEGVTTVDLGDRIALMNKRGQVTGYMPKTQAPRGPMALGPDQRLVDPTTGKEIAGATGGMKPPRVEKIKQADGSEVSVQWDEKQGVFIPLKAPEGGNPVANPKLTEQQSKDVGFYNRGAALLPRLERQDAALTQSLSSMGSKVPVVGNYLKTDAYRQAEQTGRELLAVILRKDTGAAVTPPEMDLYGNMYLPQPGDDPATVKQKQLGRKTAIDGLRMGLGTADILFKQREALDALKSGGAGVAPSAQPERPDPSVAISAARDAIAKGAPRDAVIKRLQENGIDAAGL